MLEINYIVTKLEKEMTGRLRYEGEIRKRLRNVKLNMIEYIPSKDNIIITKAVKKFLWFPYQIKRRVNKDNITHLTFEDLAFLLNFINLKKTIVTCHDLAPLVFRPYSPFLKLVIRGLKRADRIITVSNYSKNDIIKYFGYPENKIDVITDAIDHSHYYPERNKEILKRYNISENERVILYVGSERKRQNLPFLIKSFYELKKRFPKVKLVKVGIPQQSGAREDLLNLIKNLGLEKEIIFTGFVEEKELPKWYNAADLFVYPCLYAGFGLPPLEAMACGTPVITSNLTALPEVVGTAGIMINPYDKNQMADAMYKVLTNKDLRQDLVKKGLEKAKMFSWEKSAKETLKVYRRLATIG